MEVRSDTTKAQFALFLSLTINTAGHSFLLVVLPPLGRRLGFSDIQTGAILGISALLLMVSAPAWGYLSERIGRRPVLLTALAGAAGAAALFGMIVHLHLAMIAVQACAIRLLRWEPMRLRAVGAVIAVSSTMICSLGDSYIEIFGSLVMLAIGLGLMLPGNLASLSLWTGPGAQGKTAGLNVVAQGAGQAIGPLAGAMLHRVSPQAPFVAATILLTVACSVASFTWRSALQPPQTLVPHGN